MQINESPLPPINGQRGFSQLKGYSEKGFISVSYTHLDVYKRKVEGQKCAADRVFSVQYHPESAPGPQDSAYLFDEFIAMMEGK